MKVVQEILGHSSFITTADIYGHVLPQMHPDAMSHWDDEFNQEEKKNPSDDEDGEDPPGVLAKR